MDVYQKLTKKKVKKKKNYLTLKILQNNYIVIENVINLNKNNQ